MHTSPRGLYVLIILTLYVTVKEASSSPAQEFNVSEISLIPNRKRSVAGETRQFSIAPHSQLDSTNKNSSNTATGAYYGTLTPRASQITENITGTMPELQQDNSISDEERSKRLAEEQIDDFYILGKVLPEAPIPLDYDKRSTNTSCGLSLPVPTSEMFDPGGSTFIQQPVTRSILHFLHNTKHLSRRHPAYNLRHHGPYKLKRDQPYNVGLHNAHYYKGKAIARRHRPISVRSRSGIQTKDYHQKNSFHDENEEKLETDENEFQTRDFGFLGRDNPTHNAFESANEIILKFRNNIQDRSTHGLDNSNLVRPSKKSSQMSESIERGEPACMKRHQKLSELKSHVSTREQHFAGRSPNYFDTFNKGINANYKRKGSGENRPKVKGFNHDKEATQEQGAGNPCNQTKPVNILEDTKIHEYALPIKGNIKISVHIPNHIYVRPESDNTFPKRNNFTPPNQKKVDVRTNHHVTQQMINNNRMGKVGTYQIHKSNSSACTNPLKTGPLKMSYASLDDESVQDMINKLDTELKDPSKYGHKNSITPIGRFGTRGENSDIIQDNTDYLSEFRELMEGHKDTIQDSCPSQPEMQLQYLKDKDQDGIEDGSLIQPDLQFKYLNAIPQDIIKEQYPSQRELNSRNVKLGNKYSPDDYSPNQPALQFGDFKLRNQDNFQGSTFSESIVQFRGSKDSNQDTIDGNSPSQLAMQFKNFKLRNVDNFQDKTFDQSPMQFRDLKLPNQDSIEDNSSPFQRELGLRDFKVRDEDNFQDKTLNKSPVQVSAFEVRNQGTMEHNRISHPELKLGDFRERDQHTILDKTRSQPNQRFLDNIYNNFPSQPELKFRVSQVEDNSSNNPALEIKDIEKREQEADVSQRFVQQLKQISRLEKNNERMLGEQHLSGMDQHRNNASNVDQSGDLEDKNNGQVETNTHLTRNNRPENVEPNRDQFGDLEYKKDRIIGKDKDLTENIEPNEDQFGYLEHTNDQKTGINNYLTANNLPENLEQNEDHFEGIEYINNQRVGTNKYLTENNRLENLEPHGDRIENTVRDEGSSFGVDKYTTGNARARYWKESPVAPGRRLVRRQLGAEQFRQYGDGVAVEDGKSQPGVLTAVVNGHLNQPEPQRLQRLTKLRRWLRQIKSSSSSSPSPPVAAAFPVQPAHPVAANSSVAVNLPVLVNRQVAANPPASVILPAPVNPPVVVAHPPVAVVPPAATVNPVVNIPPVTVIQNTTPVPAQHVLLRTAAPIIPATTPYMTNNVPQQTMDTANVFNQTSTITGFTPYPDNLLISYEPLAYARPSLTSLILNQSTVRPLMSAPVLRNSEIYPESLRQILPAPYNDEEMAPSPLRRQQMVPPLFGDEKVVPSPLRDEVYVDYSNEDYGEDYVGSGRRGPRVDDGGLVQDEDEPSQQKVSYRQLPIMYRYIDQDPSAYYEDDDVENDASPADQKRDTNSSGSVKTQATPVTDKNEVTPTPTPKGNTTAVGNGTDSRTNGSHQYEIFTDDAHMSQTRHNDSVEDIPASTTPKNINETAILQKMLADLRKIKSEKPVDKSKDGLTCTLDGTWITDVAGVKLTIAVKETGPSNVLVALRSPPRKHALLSKGWTMRINVPFKHGGPFVITGFSGDKRIARFIGQCRVCHNRDIVTGIWTIAHSARDCRELDMAMTTNIRRDVFRREKPLSTTTEAPETTESNASESTTSASSSKQKTTPAAMDRRARSWDSDSNYEDEDPTNWFWNYDD